VEQDAALVGVAPQALDAGLEGGLGEAFGDLLVEFGKRVRLFRAIKVENFASAPTRTPSPPHATLVTGKVENKSKR